MAKTFDPASAWSLLEPALADEGLELIDIEPEALPGGRGTLRVLVENRPDHPSGPRIDLDGVARATHLVSALLDEPDIVGVPYTLEVSSPGLERPLRLPAHFLAHIGATVALKTKPGTSGDRRCEGILSTADPSDDGCVVVGDRTVAYRDIERARTVFVWAPPAKPKAPGKNAKHPRVATLSSVGEPNPSRLADGESDQGELL